MKKANLEERDNWQHRDKTMRCRTCMWFTYKEVEVPVTKALSGCLGRCRRHAPCGVVVGWPAVYEADWCGDHKLDENK